MIDENKTCNKINKDVAKAISSKLEELKLHRIIRIERNTGFF